MVLAALGSLALAGTALAAALQGGAKAEAEAQPEARECTRAEAGGEAEAEPEAGEAECAEPSEGEGGAGEGGGSEGEGSEREAVESGEAAGGGADPGAGAGGEAVSPALEAGSAAEAEDGEAAPAGSEAAKPGGVERGGEIAAGKGAEGRGAAGQSRQKKRGSGNEGKQDGEAREAKGNRSGNGNSEAGEGGGGESGSLSSLAIGDGESGSLEVPIALLSVYQSCGSRYGISWEVLAAINKIETDFGSNLGPSSAGAEGWMQFLPSSWKEWGIDADGDGKAETDDPVDAICSAARYLAAAGGEKDIYDAVLAYNHADWYAREVLAEARRYERVPANLVNSLTALSSGSTFPVSGKVSFWNQAEVEESLSGNSLTAGTLSSEAGESGEGGDAEERGRVTIGAEVGARVRAVVDGTVTKVGRDDELGRYLVLRDPYGDRLVYSSLGATSVHAGDEVEEGQTLAAVGERGGIVFSAQPDGGSKLDATELLEIWKQGGVGKIYEVDARSADKGSAASRALLMSSGALRREVLADPDLELPRCVRRAVSHGELQRQALASLEYLTGRGYEVGVSASTCKHRSGFVVEIASVDGSSVRGNQGRGTAARSLVRTALAMDGSAAPQRLVSEAGLAGSSAGDGGSGRIEIDYRPPQKARIVDGDAVAPVDAPAAVQEMIAAANQIDEEPYVWGGGHGSWVSEGYDCSGAVSYVLHAAGMLSSPATSGALESWGESGSGNWVTVYANSGHTYAVIAGLRWDTVGDVSGSGPRWHDAAAYPEGFEVRHPTGY